MRALVASVAVHLALLALLVVLHDSDGPADPRPAVAMVEIADAPPVVVDFVGGGGGGGGGISSDTAKDALDAVAAAPVRRSAPRSAPDAWEQVVVSMDRAGNGIASRDGTGTAIEDGTGIGDGTGTGDGIGTGAGTGIGDGTGAGTGAGIGAGIGNGHGVRIADDVLTVPVPQPPAEAKRVSKAQPAKLIYPTRDLEVEDEGDLFIARVTVDSEGDVIGARMTKTRPGSRGDQAANAIWSFRYLPALDDEGRAIKSTFEQPFQIRR